MSTPASPNPHEETSSIGVCSPSRRQVIKGGVAAAAGGTMATTLASRAYAAEDNTIRLALIGCGGRGTGAAVNALSAPGGPVKLHAMADLFPNQLNRSHAALQRKFADRMDVPEDRRFVGFDAYQHAIDSLRPGDVAMLTAYSYCRPTHFAYAVTKGINVFMEKSFAPDPGGSQRMLRTGEEAEKKGLKVATGLMCRHSVARQALIEKVRSGELGDILHIRARRTSGARRLNARPTSEQSELLFQIRNKWHFMWAASGQFIEWVIHQIDECCWIKDAWPVAAIGLGGRLPGATDLGQDLDAYDVEYLFPDGTRCRVEGRFVNNVDNEFTTVFWGTKQAAHFSGPGHNANSAIFKDHHVDRKNIAWAAPAEPTNPWQAEWNVLLAKIRNNEPHNETKRSLYTNLVSIMGRAACHTGRRVTWDDVSNSDFVFCNYVDDLNAESPPPVSADATGQYPVPLPGKWQEV